MIGFGIIGCGMIAEFHANAIRQIPGARLIGVTDASAARARAFAEERGVRAFATAEDMASCPDIQAVCICTPSGTHADLGILAAEHGRHVVVEKPIAVTMKQADALKSACDQYKVHCCGISQMRFMQGPRSVKKALENGALGRVISCQLSMLYHRPASYYASSGWRGTWAMDGGGALMNQGIHGVDLMRWLMGPVESIGARMATLVHEIETEDTISAVVSFRSGAQGVLQAETSVTPGKPLRLGIQGTRGILALEEARIVDWHVDGVPRPDESVLLEARDAGGNDPRSIDPAGHLMQLTDFVESLREGRKPWVTMEDGYEAVRIITSAYESARENRFVSLEADA